MQEHSPATGTGSEIPELVFKQYYEVGSREALREALRVPHPINDFEERVPRFFAVFKHLRWYPIQAYSLLFGILRTA